ncbi:MAG: DUF2339 domain-containing protein [Clostridia bacterium]|nr:DUF2339 domain-containing protein [Clostridia bacterium]
MSIADNLKENLLRQKEILASLENEIIEFERKDLVSENDKLNEEISQCQVFLKEEKDRNLQISEENKGLKNALYEEIYNEKMAILNMANKKLDVYFEANVEGEINRLAQIEITTKSRIAKMTAMLQESRIDLEDETYEKLSELKELINSKITTVREELAKQTGAFSQNINEEFTNLRQEQITADQMKGVMKKNNIESLIGLNVLNKIGVFMVVIGVIAATQFTYFQLPDVLKGIFSFIGGLILLAAGEFLNRKKTNVFSLGLTSGGVAVLYVALALSYFHLEILGMYPALLLCVLITACSFVLSQRYNSQTVVAFALIGGYLPLFSIAGSKVLVFSAMAYFIILNLLALIISVNKKWIVSMYIGFVLNVGATIYIMALMFSMRKYSLPFGLNDFIMLLYMTFAFIIYTLIPIASTYMKNMRFKNSDIVLLGLNTVISALLMYVAFYELNLSDFTGLLAITFAGIYLAVGRFIESHLTQEKKAKALFYLTGFTFVVLIIPFQFGKMWLSLGWLVEGVALLTYGILHEEKVFQKSGLVISALCLGAFLFFDVLNGYEYLFSYKYFAITLGSIIILAALAFKKKMVGRGIKYFKYGTAINFWLFMMYMISQELETVLEDALYPSYLNVDYLIFALMIVVSYLIAYIIPRIRILSDFVMKCISMVIYGLALMSLFILNVDSFIQWNYLGCASVPLIINIIGTIVLVIISLLSLLALRDLILCLVMERKLGVEWYPLVVSAYFVLILTQSLITQYHLGFNNAAISIIYVLMALSWIIFGFVKRYALLRRFGLGLSILAVAKLFILDLSFLSQGARIISYFAFGITLIAISFVYQYFNKRLELKGELLPDEKKIDL